MGLLNFFKKKKEIEQKINEITLSEANTLVKEKLEKEKKRVSEIENELDNKINEFISNIKEQIKILNSINLERRKESERIKELVLYNLREYIIELNRLIENLRDAKKDNLYLDKINSSLNLFQKNSEKNLQKANILIGKEIMVIEKIIKEFYKYFNQIYQNNMLVISKIKDINKLQDTKKISENMQKTLDDEKEILSNLVKEKEKNIDKKENIEKEFNLFKQGKEFKEWVKNKEALREKIKELDKKINLFKEKIDFKYLLKKFHEIEKIRKLIRSYRDNFIEGLENDKKLSIAEIINKNEAEELREIVDRKSQLEKESKIYNLNDKNNKFLEELEKINYNISGMDDKINEEKRKLNKINEKTETLQKEIIKMSEDILNIKIK